MGARTETTRSEPVPRKRVPALTTLIVDVLASGGQAEVPHLLPAISSIQRQFLDNYATHTGLDGVIIPYTFVRSDVLVEDVFQEPYSPRPGKILNPYYAGFEGNIADGVTHSIEDIFQDIHDHKNGRQRPTKYYYYIGPPTNPGGKLTDAWVSNFIERGFPYYAETEVDLLRHIRSQQNGSPFTALDQFGRSMGASVVYEALKIIEASDAIPQTASLSKPVGSHKEEVHRVGKGAIQLGVGFEAEGIIRRSRNKIAGRTDSSELKDRFLESLREEVAARGIPIHDDPDQKRLKRQLMLAEVNHLLRRPAIPPNGVKIDIDKGIGDLLSFSLADPLRYMAGKREEEVGNTTQRLTPSSHSQGRNTKELITFIRDTVKEIPLTEERKAAYLNYVEDKILTKNRVEKDGESHTRPAVPHYDHLWLWDECFAGQINNDRGEPERAASGLTTLLKGVDPQNGFLANMQFRTGRNWRDVESWTFNRPNKESSYTQPPVTAWAAWDTYKEFERQRRITEGRAFLESVYGNDTIGKMSGLQGEYAYFRNTRRNGHGTLNGNIHPHETGMDSSAHLEENVFQLNGGLKRRFPESVGHANTLLSYGRVLGLGIKAKFRDWDPEKMKDVFWVEDVSFNAMYADNLFAMAQIAHTLGKPGDVTKYTEEAQAVENDINRYLWDDQKKFFYSIDKNGRQIPKDTVTGLFGFMLRDLPEDRLNGLLDAVEDPQMFGTPYMFPSVAVHEKTFDPDYKRKRLWDGEVWTNADQLIAQGMARHLLRTDLSPQTLKRLERDMWLVVDKNQEMVENDMLRTGTTHEFYNPYTGEGYRIEGFTWTLGARHTRGMINKVLSGNYYHELD